MFPFGTRSSMSYGMARQSVSRQQVFLAFCGAANYRLVFARLGYCDDLRYLRFLWPALSRSRLPIITGNGIARE
jgi:hypothetical protein